MLGETPRQKRLEICNQRCFCFVLILVSQFIFYFFLHPSTLRQLFNIFPLFSLLSYHILHVKELLFLVCADALIKHITCKGLDNSKHNYSKLSYHCQQFGLYAR